MMAKFEDPTLQKIENEHSRIIGIEKAEVAVVPGIISQLSHFKCIGVETLWISPIYKSPQKDFGYDISDLRDVDPLFGNITDFRRLVDEAKKLGLRIILDFVPNHTSDQHDWFQKSLKKEGKYTDFYVWHNGKQLDNGTVIRPNNWLGIFGGSVWTWSPERQQYYLHQFTPYQPDLNYRNPDVREEIMLAMRYWLDQGIDGLRMDAIANLYEDEQFRDNPLSGKPVPSDDWNYLIPTYTDYLVPEVPQEIMRWQSVFDSLTKLDGKERFMVLEFYTDSDTRAKMAEFGAHPFNMDMVDSLVIPLNASQMMGLISQEYSNKPASYWPTFVVGNHDRKRVASKYGRHTVNAFNMLLMTLKGTPTTYYGEELGMEDIMLPYEESQDPWAINAGPDRYLLVSRDVNRSPMQWTDGSMAGFTTGSKTWLPVQANYTQLNVQIERLARNGLDMDEDDADRGELLSLRSHEEVTGHRTKTSHGEDNDVSHAREDDSVLRAPKQGKRKRRTSKRFGILLSIVCCLWELFANCYVYTEKLDVKSHLNLYKEYASLRQLDAFKYGNINVNMVTNDNVLSFLRYFGSERYLVAINFGQNESTDDYSVRLVNSDSGVVVSDTGSVDAAIAKGANVNLRQLKLKPGDGVVVKVN
ncbi:Maltase 1 [Bulinus truncatus]|nr:Maltase 1 [Bulinus truncatus]